MKYLLFTDNHFCERSSIVSKYGQKYSLRLENQIKSLNWVEQLAMDEHCDAVICLGDFFDKPTLNDNEITAAKEIKWNGKPHLFIVGNHESNIHSLECSSTMMLQDFNREIISQPCTYPVNDKFEFCILPYIIESDRKSIEEYFGPKPEGKKRIILSHNDLKGVQMGPVISKTGFDIKDIQDNCDLFINGHLHNGQTVAKKVINLGNLTGKDFGEDATKYAHNVMILDTELGKYNLIENPFAFNFYQFTINSYEDFAQLKSIKDNAVLSVKCKEIYMDEIKGLIAELADKIVASRIIMIKDVVVAEADNELLADISVSYDEKFKVFCKSVINNDKILEDELSELFK